MDTETDSRSGKIAGTSIEIVPYVKEGDVMEERDRHRYDPNRSQGGCYGS
jgi:hypothetical protein